MPITVEIVDTNVEKTDIDAVFSYFVYIDNTFSTYKTDSEITKINHGLLKPEQYSANMKEVFKLSLETKQITKGYFDIINRDGIYDPSGLVKGWAIYKAALLLKDRGREHFYINAGGDVQVSGKNNEKKWTVGIQDPFSKKEQIIKVLYVENEGVATSGSYIRGEHIYNPHKKAEIIPDIVSLTVIGDNIYEADRFATAAYAMGKEGIDFIESLPGFEGYMINKQGIATMTSGFEKYTAE